MVPYYGMIPYVPYHTIPYWILFDVPFTVSTDLVINNGMMHSYNTHHNNIPYHLPRLHNPKDFYAVLMDGHYDILLHNGDYKRDILDIQFWPPTADWEAEAEMRLKD